MFFSYTFNISLLLNTANQEKYKKRTSTRLALLFKLPLISYEMAYFDSSGIQNTLLLCEFYGFGT